MLSKLRASLLACAGDIVFGMEDGTVSIFGLVLGVAASSTDRRAVLIAGCSGACAAAVSMMAGVYLEAETQAADGTVTASPLTRALWMLAADFLAAAIPIVPFAIFSVAQARYASAGITLMLLAGLGAGRAQIAGKRLMTTIIETTAIGVAAAIVGVAIGALLSNTLH